MKAYEIQKGAKSLDGVKRVERPEPKAGSGQILVRMRAASLNYRDQMVVIGAYFGGSVPSNTIPLSDGAGEVTAVGAGVTRFKVGDRVTGTFFRDWVDGRPPLAPRVSLGAAGADGVLAEYVVFDERDAVTVPAHLSFEEAATLPCAGVTAWHAVNVVGNIRSGQTVLVLGTGGVSIFALQFGRAAGARVIATSASDEKLARAKALGADVLINYKRTPEWEKTVLEATNGHGVDCVVEVGGPGTLARSMQVAGFHGKVALIGFVAGREGDTNPAALMRKWASIHGIFVGHRTMFEDMNAAITVNKLRPVIDKVFPFDKALDAYRYLQSAAHFGKIVISI